MMTHAIFYTLALVVLLLGAVVGLTLASAVFSSQPRPRTRAFLHMTLGLIGISLLTTASFLNPDRGLSNIALIIFILVACGGLLLYTFRQRAKQPPAVIIALHALGAVTGISLLFYIVLHL